MKRIIHPRLIHGPLAVRARAEFEAGRVADAQRRRRRDAWLAAGGDSVARWQQWCDSTEQEREWLLEVVARGVV